MEIEDKAAEYFFYRCAGCHTVGGGKLSGPDLITSTQWNMADLKSSIKKMEKNVGSISEEDLNLIAEFLKDVTVSKRIEKQKEKIEKALRAEMPAPSFEKGKKLFKGKQVLKNGGPACITCHQFVSEGGNLGPDLTTVKDKLSGVALQSGIENSGYKIMRSIYEKKKITKEESMHLSEYLSHPEKVDSRSHATIQALVSLAVIAFSLFFILLWLLNKNRKGSARKNLIEKSKRGKL